MATAATYAQFVLGTPGAGKSTYCAGRYLIWQSRVDRVTQLSGMSEFMRLLKRKCVVVNLDPANDRLPYECAVDIRELVRLEDVMERHTPEAGDAEESFGLGPNGGLVFCIEYLEKNLDWLRSALKPFESQWILFDCPGQVELYTVHTSMRNIFRAITNDWQWRTACVHLVDVAHCLDASRYISALLLSLTAMLHLELPHVNVLSKIDQLRQFGRLRKCIVV